MLNFKSVTIAFTALLIAMIGYRFVFFIPLSAFIFLLLVYLGLLVYGSSNVRSNFYLKTISSGNTGRKQIALSFDDGPLPGYTLNILETLRLHRVEAAFFCIGKRVEENEDLLKAVYKEGHIVGNHSYSHHLWFDLFSAQKMENDLRLANEAIQKAIGVQPRLFRPPYGVTNPNLQKAVQKNGFTTIGWNVRSLDTVIKDEQKLLKRVTERLKPGAIILFHDSGKATVHILSAFISHCKQRGYDIVRLDKLLNLEPYV